MRITMVVPSYPKLSETFLVNKFVGLTEAGHHVTVVCQQRADSAWKLFQTLEDRPELRSRVVEAWPDGAPARVVASLTRHLLALGQETRTALLRSARSPGDSLRSALGKLPMTAAIAASRPDVVHFEFGAIALPYLHLHNALGAKFVASFRGYDLNYVGLDEPDYYLPLFAAVDAVHTLGDDLWRRALQRGCPADLPHVLIPPAIDTSFFQPQQPRPGGVTGSPERPLRIVSVGRLEWKKGYEYALAAVRMLVDRGITVRYRILGGGNYLGPLSFCRHQLGLEEIVEFSGAGDRDLVRREMEDADLLLHPAVSEGFCNAVVEAQAMELPVVCTDADGLAENVAHGETGFVVPRRDSAAMADRMEELGSHPELRGRMGTNGRKRAVERFRLADQISAFEAFYQSLVHSN